MNKVLIELFLLCATTVAVLVVVYQLTGDPLPLSADQSSVANKIDARAVSTLRFIAIITRHGNRAPVVTYPSSPYQCNDTKVWPYGPGELTHSGRVQLYNLGTRLRSLYNGFLSSYYSPSDFRAFSTQAGRALESAELFLAGLFPPTGFQVWNQDLLWQPVAIFPNAIDHYKLIKPSENRWCPKFHKAKTESLKRVETNYGSNITDFFRYVIPHTGFEQMTKELTTPGSLYRLNSIYAMFESFIHPEAEGFPLPDWSQKIYPQPLTFLFNKYYKAISGDSDTQIKYLEGELFQSIVEAMRAKIYNSIGPDRRMHYYSGHDFTIIGLLNIMGLGGAVGPIIRTGSTLILELHHDPVKGDGSSFVQVLYIDGSSQNLEPKHLNIPGCDSPCDFRLFTNITEKYYKIKDWEKECQLDKNV